MSKLLRFRDRCVSAGVINRSDFADLRLSAQAKKFADDSGGNIPAWMAQIGTWAGMTMPRLALLHRLPSGGRRPIAMDVIC